MIPTYAPRDKIIRSKPHGKYGLAPMPVRTTMNSIKATFESRILFLWNAATLLILIGLGSVRHQNVGKEIIFLIVSHFRTCDKPI